MLTKVNGVFMAPIPEVNETTLQLSAPDTQLRILAEAIPQMVWSTDAKGCVHYANKRWYNYTGLSYDQTRNMQWLTAVHPDDRELTEQSWQAAVKSGKIYEVEHRLRAGNNEYRWHLSRALPIKDPSGDITSWFGTSTDIEDQRQASDQAKAILEQNVSERTEALKIARDEALRASALKSQFVQNISHEIRTPMSGILGMSELLSEMEMSPEAREMAHHILLSANTLMGIVNDLLDFSKLEANKATLQKSEFSLRELLEYGSLSVSPEVSKKKIEFHVNVADELPDRFMGDAQKIRQVLGNLLNNATKFTESGDIKVTVTEQARTENWYSVRFCVEDSGIGIDDETRLKLFEPFVQADGSITRRYGGTGLGLSICRKLVTLMNGEIGVNSKLSEGSSFWFTVPLEKVG